DVKQIPMMSMKTGGVVIAAREGSVPFGGVVRELVASGQARFGGIGGAELVLLDDLDLERGFEVDYGERDEDADV
ncbi:MAG: hypothetical protein VXY56_07765, partial [Pseudomonadota bacterium]|nr:hypothetical protein [Pseudomonadota bacterium]